jgi:sensor c-di-GMP phosphodiesterase-like protein
MFEQQNSIYRLKKGAECELRAVTQLQVIVEGVEQEVQVTKLKAAGIELAQGFYRK